MRRPGTSSAALTGGAARNTAGDAAQEVAATGAAVAAASACVATEAGAALAGLCATFAGMFASGAVSFVEGIFSGSDECTAGWMCSQATPEDWASHMTPSAINQVNAAFNAIPEMKALVDLFASLSPVPEFNMPAGRPDRAYLSKMYETFVRANLTVAEITNNSKLADVATVANSPQISGCCPPGQVDVSEKSAWECDCRDAGSVEGLTKLVEEARATELAKEGAFGGGLDNLEVTSDSGSGSGLLWLGGAAAAAALVYANRKKLFHHSNRGLHK